MSFEFLMTSFIIAISPGTGVIITLAAGLSQGRKAALIAALGCTLGIIPHMLAAITGLAALLHTSALAFEMIKYAGVVYLLYMAWMTLKENGTLKIETNKKHSSTFQVIKSAMLVNVLNPKLSIFFFAFLPQFVPADINNPLPLMLELSIVFMLITFLVFAIYGVFAASVRDYVVSKQNVLTWLRRSFSAAFVLLGVKLALTTRTN